jgi:hypothetical protein
MQREFYECEKVVFGLIRVVERQADRRNGRCLWQCCVCLSDDNAIDPGPYRPSHPSHEESMVFEVVDYSAIRPGKALAILRRRR